MSPLNDRRKTSSLAPPTFYVAKNQQLKDRRFLIDLNKAEGKWFSNIFSLGYQS
jgi:hypothetical protein